MSADGGGAPAAPRATPGARLAAVRAAARAEAEAALTARGFGADAAGDWAGPLPLPFPEGAASLAARVRLPERFPDELPEVLVARADLARRVAHVERSGKVCVAPSSGVLLDAGRPAALVDEALDRAAAEVASGLAGRTEGDLQAEFLAYWGGHSGPRVYSICVDGGACREVALTRLVGPGPLPANAALAADSTGEAAAWATRIGMRAESGGRALFVPLATAFPPPDFDEAVSVRRLRELVDAHAAPADAEAARVWVRGAPLPATVLLSFPAVPVDAGRGVVAVRVEPAAGTDRKRAQAGFRPGKAPPGRELGFVLNAPSTKLDLVRLDAGYLGARGGAAAGLAARTVVVIGLGAVGSHAAAHLAALGIGHSRYLDPDRFGPENVHRHYLGVRHLWQNKAVAVAAELGARFSHLAFEAVESRVEDVLQADPGVVLNADLVVIAVGDETLELRLNELFAGGPPRVHAWVEPLGVAGHALACGVANASPGCFRCLFEPDPALGLVNRAALTAPGQEIRRSLAGCAGTFSPFSALDAGRTALEAAQLAARVLSGAERGNALISWRGDSGEFEAAGYALSRRATLIAPGGRARVTDFARPGCADCDDARPAALGGDDRA